MAKSKPVEGTDLLWVAPWFGSLVSRYLHLLGEQGLRCTVLTSTRHSDHAVYAEANAVVIPEDDRVFAKFHVLWQRLRRIYLNRPRVVIFDSPDCIKDALLLSILGLISPFQIVICVHDPAPHDVQHELSWILRLLRRRATLKSGQVLVFSQSSAIQIKTLFPNVQVHIVPLIPEIDVQSYRQTSQPRSGYAMVGRWSHYKGFDIGIQLWEMFRTRTNTQETLEIWASGDVSAQSLPDGAQWRSTTNFTWDALCSNLPTYRAIIMPYRSCSQSGVQVLGWSLGVPCLVSEVAGLAEFQPNMLPALPLDEPEKWLTAMEALQDDSAAQLIAEAGMAAMNNRINDVAVVSAFQSILTL